MKTRRISCIAIDDEPLALLVISRFCERRGDIDLKTFSEPRVGIEQIRLLKPDLVLLDIEMNSISGLDVAGALPCECCFIFTTAHAQYALDGFDLDAVDFLHKPFAYERFDQARRADASMHAAVMKRRIWSSSRSTTTSRYRTATYCISRRWATM